MALLGSGKRILMVGGEGVALFGPTARGVERETTISWEVPNFDQQLIDALTEQNQSAAVLVLFDGADQTYRKEENIPKLMPMDRARYIKRKLEMAFPSYPVRGSFLVKPAKKAGRNGQQDAPFYLFVALPETERLDKIGADILEAGVPVSGFGLLPAESVGLVTALSDKLFVADEKRSRWAVLIGQNETGGLRQVVVKNGNLALTRMTPTSEAGTQGPAWAEEVIREFRGTLTYIARFGYNAEEGLDVIVICGNIEKEFFNQKALPVTNFQCLTTAEALAAIGSKGIGLEETNFSDAVHAAWASKKRALTVPIVVPSINRIMVPRTGARIASFALALLFLALGFFIFGEYNLYNETQANIARQQSQKALLDQEYTQESKVFDALPVKPAMIRGALAIRNFIESSSVRITPVFNLLRKTLESDIKLEDLKFEHTPAAALRGGSTSVTPLPVPGAPIDKGSIRITFKFTIMGNATLEQKVTRAETLAENLRRAFPGFQVNIIGQFGGVSRTGRFEGEAGKGEAGSKESEIAEFEMVGVPL